MAGIAAAVCSVVAAGTLSAMFVDHLADRAVMRAAAAAPAAAREAARTEVAKKAEAALAAAKSPPPKAPIQHADVKAKAAPVALAAAAAQRSAASKPAAAPKFPGEKTAPPAPAVLAYAGGDDTAQREIDAPADATQTAAIATVPLPASAPAPEPRKPGEELAAKEEPAEGGREGRVTKHVNMRSGPNDESKVVAVVPAKASVSVLDCKSWCEVVFDGKKGWIYKRFIRES
jgi:hypothetical protein